MWTSALPKGKVREIQFPRDVTHLGDDPVSTRNIAIGWMKLGLVIILILRRETVIKRKMMELGMIGTLVRMCAHWTLVKPRSQRNLAPSPSPVELAGQAEV